MMLLHTGRAEIHIYKGERLTSGHACYISQGVGSCHNPLRVVTHCQLFTSALTSARGPV